MADPGTGAAAAAAAGAGAGAHLKHKRVVLDSRERDRAVFPTPDRYEVRLDDDIENVVSVKLVSACVPFPAYLVSARNNRVPCQVGGGGAATVDVLLDTGDYTDGQDLAAALQAAVAAAFPAAGFAVSHSARRDTIAVRAQLPFVLPFGGGGTAAAVLGFAPGASYAAAPDPAAPGTFVVEAPFRCNLRRDTYAILSITPNAELLVSTNNATNRTFALVPDTSRSLNMHLVDDAPVVKTWKTPLARVAKVGVEFTHYDGTPFDFQNQEHHIELVFGSLDQRKYSFF